MTKSPSEMKELISEWSQYWGYTVVDAKERNSDLPLEWILEIKNSTNTIIVYTDNMTPDVLRFQTKISFSPEHRQKTAILPNKEYNVFILETTDRLVNMGCDWSFEHDKGNPKQMNSLTLYYFEVYDSLDKNKYLQTLNKCFIHTNQMIRAIGIPLNKLAETDLNSKTLERENIYIK
jgi:hypothetical protein